MQKFEISPPALRFFFSFFLFIFFPLNAAFAQLKPHIAILDLENQGIAESEAATLSGRLRGHLVNLNTFIVLDRGTMEDILKEQSFQQSGGNKTTSLPPFQWPPSGK